MPFITHTRRRRSSFVFRRKVPKYLRDRLGMTEVVRSLKTNSPLAAKLRTAQLWVATERFFQMHGKFDADGSRLGTELSPADLDRFLAHVTNTFDAGHPFKRFSPVDAQPDQACALAAEVGLRVGKDGPQLERLCQVIERVLAYPNPAAAEDGQAPDAGRTGAHKLRRGNIPFTMIWKEFEEDQLRLGRWRPAIARQNRSSASLFVEICGDKPLSSYSPADGSKFRRILRSLPCDYSKNPEFRKIYLTHGPTRLADETAGREEIKRLSLKTCNRHFAAFSGFWKFARREACVATDAPSIFDGLHIAIPMGRNAPIQAFQTRPIWSERFMRAVFSSPLFYGCKARNAWRKPGPFVFRDERYWGILLAPHQGLRREELFQLKVQNVKCDPTTKIWYFDLFSPDLILKEVGSRRLVPLHVNILKLGFIEARVEGRQPDDFLFPEAKPSATDGKKGDNFGKFFSFFRQDIVSKVRGQPCDADDDEPDARYEDMVYHAARHTVVTLLYRAGAPIAHCEELIGHESRERRSEFSRYNKGMTLRALKECIDKIVLPIDVDALQAAVRRSESIERATAWPALDKQVPPHSQLRKCETAPSAER